MKIVFSFLDEFYSILFRRLQHSFFDIIKLETKGTHYLSVALRYITVRIIFFISYILVSLYLTQKLTTLDLGKNQIAEKGAQDLSKA